ncbi:MAG: DUF4258 domain-containing protein [Alphaproteobacteria bacterium]|jgi:hypothetical protein|nr:DUF4258 domain-containing protein [Alphaproteobacteria bacterium]
MFERSIGKDDIIQVLEQGEVIREYREDQPYPSRLVLGYVGETPIHVVVASGTEPPRDVIVTVYLPDMDRWLPDYRTRRNK